MRGQAPNEYRVRRAGRFSSSDAASMNGAFAIPLKGFGHRIIATCLVSDGTAPELPGWEHVSVRILEYGKFRIPTWAEMCAVKDLFWDEDEVVVQYHPAKQNYVNINSDVLHLWKYREPFPAPARIELDKDFEDNVSRLVQEEEYSYGGFGGMLEAVNIHGGARRFWLYPRLGPVRVRCDFLPGTSEQLREALGHYVHVIGLKYFRPFYPFPFRIAVKEFEIVDNEQPVSLHQIGGIAPEATGEMTAVEFVRKIRNEWD